MKSFHAGSDGAGVNSLGPHMLHTCHHTIRPTSTHGRRGDTERGGEGLIQQQKAKCNLVSPKKVDRMNSLGGGWVGGDEDLEKTGSSSQQNNML